MSKKITLINEEEVEPTEREQQFYDAGVDEGYEKGHSDGENSIMYVLLAAVGVSMVIFIIYTIVKNN